MVVQLAKAAGRLSGHHGSAVQGMGKGKDGKGGGGSGDGGGESLLSLVARLHSTLASGSGEGVGNSGGKGGGKGSKGRKGAREFMAGDWYCGACGFHNFASRLLCWSCHSAWEAGSVKGKGKAVGKGNVEEKRSTQRGNTKGPVGGSGQRPMLAWTGKSVGGARQQDGGRADSKSADNTAGEWNKAKKGLAPTTGKPQVGARTTNRWSAFMEDQPSDNDDVFSVDEEHRYGGREEEDDDVEDGNGGFDVDDDDDDGEEEEDEEDGNEEPSNILEELQWRHEADNEVVRALQHLPKDSDARVRAKEVAAESRNRLEQAQREEQQRRLVQVRMRAMQRKIEKAERKLDGIKKERTEAQRWFEDKDSELQGRQQDWEAKLLEWNEQWHKCCQEATAEDTSDTAYGKAKIHCRHVDDAGALVQELLSCTESEENRMVLGKLAESLVGISAAFAEREQNGPQGKQAVHCNVAEGDAEDSEGEEKRSRRVVPSAPNAIPEKWMRKAKQTGIGQKEEANKPARLGNTAELFEAAKGKIGRRPTVEEEVEMARLVVAAADDKYKGQQLSEQGKKAVLEEACREMANWIYESTPQMHADEAALQMATWARCNARVEEAVMVLSKRRQEDANAAAAAAQAGMDTVAST